MGKDIAKKFEGKWIQDKAENMDAVMVELGQGYIVRKTAAMMTVRTEVVVKDEGLHFSTKTKLKNFDSLLPWTGSSTQKGMADEPVETQMTFEGEKIIVKSQNVKAGSKLVNSDREFYMEGEFMVIKQTVNGVTGLRYFKRE